MHTTIVIPARLNSSRLPNKILLDLKGKSVVQRVYEQCLKVRGVNTIIIAVDDDKVLSHCKQFMESVMMTSKSHQSGTDRIAEVARQMETDFIVNVQGDEPFIDPNLIEDIIAGYQKGIAVVSGMFRIKEVSELLNPNAVKVVIDKNNEALYFSRAPIPYYRDEMIAWQAEDKLPEEVNVYRHLGIYGYDKEALIRFSSLPQTTLEIAEKLEQLRFLENGDRIKMVETDKATVGIDTEEDYKAALALLK
ncbi:3-deoxy-manno-octulosonate cytidylyltransferase [Dokdonia sinensis]|uniref:3-deoxy-manno-octulosonate cytidylyltransferase n=1 Tax=Dokdonia sinensis TaxID=2479847 RepID=A0A3M0FY47_9FLAO|nr:3-deoxy-manno-octulosonate cytidylyltransferase [Dokdonia sinensis]RMB57621.1 3-deoxy-manno-octulosonate cytidylyltransferase [Dokdonia sinensis]